MKKIILIIGLVTLSGGAYAATCPAGWIELPLEHATLTSGTCPSGTTSYFHIDNKCSANVLK